MEEPPEPGPIEFEPAPEKQPGPFATSSSIERYNSSFADFINCDLNAFLLTLADHHQEIIMEAIDTLTEQVVDKVQVIQPSIFCPRCKKETENSSDLISHFYTHMDKPQQIWKTFGVIPLEYNEMLIEAQDTQMRNSFCKRKIENRDFTIGCPLTSPLFRFFGGRLLKVYMDEQPLLKNSKHRVAKMELKRPERSYPLFFCWAGIDKHRGRIKKAMKEKREKHMNRYYDQNFRTNKVDTEDVILKKERTKEENDDIAQAMNLPKDFTEEQLKTAIKALEAYKPHVPENRLKYNALEDQDGNKLNKEQRKLISTLSGNMVFVPEGKRRTRNRTFKGYSYDGFGSSRNDAAKKIKLEEPDDYEGPSTSGPSTSGPPVRNNDPYRPVHAKIPSTSRVIKIEEPDDYDDN